MKRLSMAGLLAAALVAGGTSAALADTQMTNAASTANDASTGTAAWTAGTFPAFANLSDVTGNPVTSNYLVIKGFSFTLPADAIILGIQASITRSCAVLFGSTCVDTKVVIVKGGTPGTDNHSTGASWTANSSYGSPTDLWGQTWTAADINSPTFGFAVSASADGNPSTIATPAATAASMTVTYTVPCPATLDTAGCDVSFETASLKIDERTSGKEKIQAKLGKGAAITQMTIGNYTSASGPLAAVCIYDSSTALVGELVVDAAGDTCEDGKPCWSSKGGDYPDGKGFNYKNKGGAHDGVTQIKLGAGDSAKGQVKASGASGQIPTGIAAQLAGESAATVQIRGTSPFCLSAALGEISKNTTTQFSAKK